jgi:diguanylate cyclase (GGDEF)-like protein
MSIILKDTNARRVALILSLYYAILLTASVWPLELPVNREVVMRWLIFFGLPTLLIACDALWRAARLAMAELAYKDDLTGIGNRRAFTQHTNDLLKHARPGSLALLLLDVDGLKVINDACGHQAGDDLLQTVARHLLRIHKDVYRIGGDEFAILVDRSRGSGVTTILRGLDPFLAHFSTCGHLHRISLSYGYASTWENETFTSLFQRADTRLYEFKRELYDRGAIPERRGQTEEPGEEPFAEEDDEFGPAQISSLEARRKARVERDLSASL